MYLLILFFFYPHAANLTTYILSLSPNIEGFVKTMSNPLRSGGEKMGIQRIGGDRLRVTFHHNNEIEEKNLTELQLFALLSTDLVFTDSFRNKKVDKKIWVDNQNGISLQIHLK